MLIASGYYGYETSDVKHEISVWDGSDMVIPPLA